MMQEILGRSDEIEILENLLASKTAELLAIYGRRRIGKTYLINTFFQGKALFFEWVGEASGYKQEQLARFPLAFRKAFGMDRRIPKPKDWREAFELLAEEVINYSGNQKIVIFLDELPWLAGSRGEMLRAFEHAWNSYFSKDSRVIIVLCGSAASWMIKKIVNNRKGLYGRLTHKIHLQPFNVNQARIFLESRGVYLDEIQLIEIYLVTGGVAKYLNHVSPGKSSAQIIQELCFTPTGFLSHEFDELFASLFDSSERHLEIVRSLAAAPVGLTHKELTEKSNLPSGGTLKNILEELVASGFLMTIPFYSNKKRETTYRLVDEYTLFYLRWMDQKALPTNSTYWMSKQSSPEFQAWSGYAFENFCFKHTEQIIELLKISVVVEKVWYWKHIRKNENEPPGTQIDLLIERRDRSINLCEIKFCSDAFIVTQDYAKKLRSRKEIFRKVTGYKGTLFTTLIAPFGAEKNPAYLSSIDQLVSLNNLL